MSPHGRPRRAEPILGEPPLLLDPRRWGSVVGTVGGVLFIGNYSSALGPLASTIAWTAGLLLALATLARHYVRSVP